MKKILPGYRVSPNEKEDVIKSEIKSDFKNLVVRLGRFLIFIFWPIFFYQKMRKNCFGDVFAEAIVLVLTIFGSSILIGIAIALIVEDFIFAGYLWFAYGLSYLIADME